MVIDVLSIAVGVLGILAGTAITLYWLAFKGRGDWD